MVYITTYWNFISIFIFMLSLNGDMKQMYKIDIMFIKIRNIQLLKKEYYFILYDK